ncbi:MAG: hypothetical protein JXA30_05315 [Deltaproteobacteria bacterium]|nr:hypothetical protein [Deltaproteobacteria bacterium]
MKIRLWAICAFCTLISAAHPAGVYAQQTEGAEEGQNAQPQPNAEPEPAAQPQPPLVPLAQPDCVPKCRAGYICRQGQCVSLCNPPCASDETCTEAGACVSKEARTPQPTFDEQQDSEPPYLHTGFFLRFTIGGGWTNAEAPYGIENLGYSSFFSFDIGGATSENLILHARLISSLTNHAGKDVTLDIDDDLSIETKTEAIHYLLIGGGLTYYIMPVNIYLTFVLGVAGSVFYVNTDDLTKAQKDAIKQSEGGLGINLDLGKEWWVGDEWGLGVAARFTYLSVAPNENAASDDWLSCIGFGVLFTATYN